MSGGAAGGGLGATLGTIAAAALAPETGGASMLVDAGLDATTAAALTGAGLGSIGGAAGGALGAAVSGGDPGKAAESGGIGGFLGGGVSGLLGGAGDAVAGTTADSLTSGASGAAGAAGADASTSAGVSGASDALSSGASQAANAGSTAASDAASSPLNSLASNAANSSPLPYTPIPGSDQAALNNLAASGASTPLPNTAVPPEATNGPSTLDQIGSWANQHLNPFSSSGSTPTTNVSGVNGAAAGKQLSTFQQYAPYAGLGLAAYGALTPAQGNKINYQQNLAQQQMLNPSFYANLPQYNMTSQTASPTSQNWYTYGQRPQTPIYTSQITPVASAQGGLVQGYARGGKVCGFAMGGQPMAPNAPIGSVPPPAAPVNPAAAMTGAAGGGAAPMGAPSPPAVMQQPASPLAALAGAISKMPAQQAAQIGHKIGSAVRNHIVNQAMFSGEGQVNGAGDGQSDSVPAKLSNGEFVVPADVTAHLGNGSSDAGGVALQKMVHSVRAHKATAHAGFPPKAHNPMQYIKKGKA